MKTRHAVSVVATLLLAGAISATAADPQRLDTESTDAIQMFRAHSEKTQHLFDTAYAYAIFPSVGKGAAGIGAAEGRGLVYQGGSVIGRAKLTQVDIGPQLGGQSYAEVIFFESPRSLDEFRDGKTAFAAGLSAVAAGDGGGGEVKYQHGVIVCTMERSGLMFEASIGGQHFKFTPMETSSPAPVPPAETTQPPAPPAPTTTQPTTPPPAQ